MPNYTTEAIKFDKKDINNIHEQIKKWAVLDETAKLAWLNEFYQRCFELQGFSSGGTIELDNIKAVAQAKEVGFVYRKENFDKQDFVNLLFLLFHEFHHVKMNYLRTDKNWKEILLKNNKMEELLFTFDVKLFRQDVSAALYKFSPREYNADKFAKNCLMYLFNKTRNNAFLYKAIEINNNLIHYFLKKIEDTVGLDYLDEEFALSYIAELKAEAEALKKLKP